MGSTSLYAAPSFSHPGRVAAIYIRDVDPADDSEYDRKVDNIIEEADDLDVPFLRVSDSADIARHAIELGLLPADALDAFVVADGARSKLASTGWIAATRAPRPFFPPDQV